MSEIKAPGRVGASPVLGPDSSDAVSAPTPASELQAAQAAQAATTDPLVAMFEAVQARFPEGLQGDRAEMVRAVVLAWLVPDELAMCRHMANASARD